MKHTHWLYIVIGVLVLYLGYSWYQTTQPTAST
jgi:hypothetical protein